MIKHQIGFERHCGVSIFIHLWNVYPSWQIRSPCINCLISKIYSSFFISSLFQSKHNNNDHFICFLLPSSLWISIYVDCQRYTNLLFFIDKSKNNLSFATTLSSFSFQQLYKSPSKSMFLIIYYFHFIDIHSPIQSNVSSYLHWVLFVGHSVLCTCEQDYFDSRN